MVILGIDTSRELGAIALTKDDLVLGELALEMKGSCLQYILVMIDYILKSTHLSIHDIDLFTVVLGPGSWSGLRIGITTSKSLAHSMNKPIVGVSTLDVLTYNFRYTEKLIYPALDAKRGQVYFAGYHCEDRIPHRFTDYRLARVENFLAEVKGPAVLLGDISLKYQNVMSDIKNLKNAVSIAPPFLSQIRGAFINEAGLHKYTRSGADDTLSLAPLYLQEAEAEKVWALKHNHNQEERY